MLLTGHTHMQSFRSSTNLVELNGGTVGGGGTGNLEKGQPFGLAVLDLRARGRLDPRPPTWSRSTPRRVGAGGAAR